METRRVTELFKTYAQVLCLRVGGWSIRTTKGHPFYVRSKGWTKAELLSPGDLLRSHDGRFNPVEEIYLTGENATVYNLRIGEFHTYFVGDPSWGFSVWAHNVGPCGPGFDNPGENLPVGNQTTFYEWEQRVAQATAREAMLTQRIEAAKTQIDQITNSIIESSETSKIMDGQIERLQDLLELMEEEASRSWTYYPPGYLD